MNRIPVAVIHLLLLLLLVHKDCIASPSPILLPGNLQELNPYIRHWEAAKFDRTKLLDAHRKHIEQKGYRQKRDLNSGEYGPSHTIKLNFFAHDREFRLVLRQNPLSVFAPDVEIENTLGPMDYDISRIYTGSLEDDDNSHIHAILTSDNHLDGTIETSSEQFYIEPSNRYSRDLSKSGIHSIVYKLSDVNMQTFMPEINMPASMETCASERLRHSMLFDDLKRRKTKSIFKLKNNKDSNNGNSDINERIRKLDKRTQEKIVGSSLLIAKKIAIEIPDKITNHRNVDSEIFFKNESLTFTKPRFSRFSINNDRIEKNSHNRRPKNDVSISHNRRKRWLPDELSPIDDHQNPPLPLDLDVPYNDDISVYTSNMNHDEIKIENSNDDFGLKLFDKQQLHREREEEKRKRKEEEVNEKEEEKKYRTSVITWSTITNENQNIYQAAIGSNNSRNRNIIGSNFNPSDNNNNNKNNKIFNSNIDNNNNSNNNNNNNGRKIYTKHKNIIVSSFNRTQIPYDDNVSTGDSSGDNNNFINNFFNTNWSTIFTGNSNNYNNNNNNENGDHRSRPSHKTHVEIITKNGATKKPNIIVNNYNPDYFNNNKQSK